MSREIILSAFRRGYLPARVRIAGRSPGLVRIQSCRSRVDLSRLDAQGQVLDSVPLRCSALESLRGLEISSVVLLLRIMLYDLRMARM